MLSLQSRKYSLLPVQSCEFSKGIKLASSFSFKPDTSLSVALGIKLLLFFFFICSCASLLLQSLFMHILTSSMQFVVLYMLVCLLLRCIWEHMLHFKPEPRYLLWSGSHDVCVLWVSSLCFRAVGWAWIKCFSLGNDHELLGVVAFVFI